MKRPQGKRGAERSLFLLLLPLPPSRLTMKTALFFLSNPQFRRSRGDSMVSLRSFFCVLAVAVAIAGRAEARELKGE